VIEYAFHCCMASQNIETFQLRMENLTHKTEHQKKTDRRKLEKKQKAERGKYMYLRAMCKKKSMDYKEATRLYVAH